MSEEEKLKFKSDVDTLLNSIRYKRLSSKSNSYNELEMVAENMTKYNKE